MSEVNLVWASLKELSEENINSIQEGIQAAYRLSYKEESDGNYYVFYVGESADVRGTLLSHIKQTENTCIGIKILQKKCAFRYAECNDVEVRRAATKQAYRHYQPLCNEVEPQGADDIIVNLS